MTMKTLTLQESGAIEKARQLINEMEDAAGDMPMPSDVPSQLPPPSGTDMPLEPPMSDSAAGANTEDNVALGLLREIRDLLSTLVGDEAAEGGEAPEIPEEPEGELEPGEPSGEEGMGAGDEDFRPGSRPMPVPTGAG